MVTDDAGTVVYSAAYTPFGKLQNTWVNIYQPKLQFSGKEREGDTGLDYYGARYYANRQYRFTSVDPVINREEAITNPQLWNLYSYCVNNPITFLDQDGRDIIYASDNLKGFFQSLAARSKTVRATLALYEGKNGPNLIVQQGQVEPDIDGTRAVGSFEADISPDYTGKFDQMNGDMTLEEVENLGNWSIREGTLIIDKSLDLVLGSKDTVSTALHELGHADQAARKPLEHFRQAPIKHNPDGTPMKHGKRPAEAYANRYEARTRAEVR